MVAPRCTNEIRASSRHESAPAALPVPGGAHAVPPALHHPARALARRDLLLPVVATSRPELLQQRPRHRAVDVAQHPSLRRQRLRHPRAQSRARTGHQPPDVFLRAAALWRDGRHLDRFHVELRPDFSNRCAGHDHRPAVDFLLGGCALHLLAGPGKKPGIQYLVAGHWRAHRPRLPREIHQRDAAPLDRPAARLHAEIPARIAPAPGFYVMLAVFAVFIAPVFIWNAQHAWITLLHLRERGGLNTGPRFNPLAFLTFLGMHFGVYSPLIFAGMLVAPRAGPGKSPARISSRGFSSPSRCRFSSSTLPWLSKKQGSQIGPPPLPSASPS